MSKEMMELCQWVKEKAMANGATDCKVTLSKRRMVELGYRQRKVETIKEATTRSLAIDIFMDGKYTVQVTPDLRKTTLEKFIADGCENTKFMEKDVFRTLPDKKHIENQLDTDLNLYDAAIPGLPSEKQHDMVKEIENACIEKGGDKVVSVESGASFNETEKYIVASNGFENSFKVTSCNAGATMTAQDEGDRRPNGYNWVGGRHLSDMPSNIEIGTLAAERTLKLLGAKKLESQTVPIIIENRTVGRILYGFLDGFYGRNIQQERSFLAEKLGLKVASSKLSIIDNPLIVKGRSSKLFDGDGFPAKKRNLLTNGTVDTFLYDWYYSRKMGVEPTTGGTSNLEFGLGDKSLVQLMKSVGEGILVTGFIGGNSNSTTGDFSVGIIGHKFENGIPVQAISEMNIADNHLEFWNKIADVGNDPYKYGGWRTPSLLFDGIMVAGK